MKPAYLSSPGLTDKENFSAPYNSGLLPSEYMNIRKFWGFFCLCTWKWMGVTRASEQLSQLAWVTPNWRSESILPRTPSRHGLEAIFSHHMLSYHLSQLLLEGGCSVTVAVKVHVQTDKQLVTETHVNAIRPLCTNSQTFLHLWLEAVSNQETVLVCSQKK